MKTNQTTEKAKALARKIAEAIMTNGSGQKAERLKMFDAHDNYLGGYSVGGLSFTISELLKGETL